MHLVEYARELLVEPVRLDRRCVDAHASEQRECVLLLWFTRGCVRAGWDGARGRRKRLLLWRRVAEDLAEFALGREYGDARRRRRVEQHRHHVFVHLVVHFHLRDTAEIYTS